MASNVFIHKIDSWIPASVGIHEEQKLRARVILSVMLLCSSSVGFVCLALLISALLSASQPLWDGVIASLAVSLVWYAGIIFFRRTENLLWSSHLFAFIMYSSTLGALLTSGGWSSPINSLLLAVPVGVFLVAGRYVGLIWSVIAAVTYYFLWLLHLNNITIVQIVRDEDMDALTVGMWCFSSFIMISCMTVYDHMAEILKLSLREERDQYRHRMTMDFISGALNRFGIEKKFDEFLKNHTDILMVYFNIANLSMINSELHYQAGDELIKQVARKSGEVFGSTAAVSRITGGEFLVLVPGVADRQTAEVQLGRLYQAFGHPFTVLEGEHEISVRGGIGAVLSIAGEFRQLLRIAHEAMLESDDQQSAFVIRQSAQAGRSAL